ncbi:MAG: hypothetical protein Q8M24_21625 [Pseudolabrys sp.]|nr:hypothetical protein [Pseudolabrys sp.]MDP2298050.1 hypothetical protein [Pseudolabrys sp.]
MPPRKQVAPERIAEGKYLYEETLTPTDEIGKRMGLSRSAFYLRVKEWGWTQRRYSHGLGEENAAPILPPPPPAVVLPAADAEPPAAAPETTSVAAPSEEPSDEPAGAFELRARNYARACAAVGRQIAIIEGIQTTLMPVQPPQAERSARVLATLNRTLLEITEATKPESVDADDADDDDAIPQDIDEFREQLARRIRGLVDAERREQGPGAGAVETA